MVIRLDKNYNAMTSTALLGYVGETNARPVSVEGMEIDGADRYVLSIDYGDGTVYEVDITGGQWTPTADVLRSAQTVSCQICAKKLSGNEYILLKKSRIFRLRIGAAIGDNAIPSPDVAVDALDKIDAIGRQAHTDMQTAVTAAETATTAAENAKKSATAAEKSADTTEQAASRAETAKTAAETAAQKAQSIADSLPDDYVTAVGKIAENTAEIGRVKLTDEELQRRVDALYSIGQGITHKFETDTDTAYAKTVPTGAKLMSVKSVGGRSIVFNQNFQPRKEINNGITATADSDGTITLNGTTTASYINFRDVTPEQNKVGKYAFKLLILNNPDSISMKFGFLNRSQSTPAITSGSSAVIYNQTQSEISLGKATGISGFAVGTVFNDVKIKIQIFDLTAMFGSGNEPTTAEEFEKIFPADYYPYNAGEIISAGKEEIVEHGRNLWDEVWGVGSINASSGNNEFSKKAIYSKNYTPIIPNSTYIFVYAGSAKIENVKTRFYDYNKNYIGYNDKDGQTVYPNKKFITPSDAFYVRFTLPPSYGNAYKNDIALIAGSSGSYAPYHSNVYQIPEAIKALPGYGVEGNAVDYEAKTYTQNNTVDGTEIKALDTPIVTDISTMLADDFLRNLTVEAGGSVTFKNSNDNYHIPVPSEEEYIVKLSEIGGTT
ncbi:hypothetical protein [Ruminococcus sp.]|uniref:hypothetical protein n=1 Tax=Ruminococcus sp. TaxID=41978 RepID=UPI003AB61603